MKKIILLAALATLLTGCMSYTRGGAGGTAEPTEPMGRGTTGVSSGADPAPGISGSEFVPGPR